jgi:hypothetical protein
MTLTFRSVLVAAIVLAVAPILTPAVPVHAAGFNVNSNADDEDTMPGDGICRTPAGMCTLRAAVMEANATPAADTINVPSGQILLRRAGYEDAARNGDLDITQPVTIRGAGMESTQIAGFAIPGGDRIFDIRPGAGTVTIEDLSIARGDANSPLSGNKGGGIRVTGSGQTRTDLWLTRVAIRDNYARGGGGGLHIDGNVVAFVNDSAIERNDTRTADGGGVLAENGGGIFLNRSAVLENHAGRGGGTFLIGTGSYVTTSTTISTNTADRQGGGVWIDFQNASYVGSRVALGTTFANNTASMAGGGGNIFNNTSANGQVFQIGGSLIANGTSENCVGVRANASMGSNLDTGNTCNFGAAGDLVNTNPNLGPLQLHNSKTRVHTLPFFSPAVDAATCFIGWDQRDVTRPQDGNRDGTSRCDMGAYELIIL